MNPCTSCGACCAYFRVAFYWREAEPKDSETPVPGDLFVEATEILRCMKGTEKKHRPKCLALKGRIGSSVACTIYENRPSPCRAFKASYSDGQPNPRCDQARAAHGLKPLRPSDWELSALSPDGL